MSEKDHRQHGNHTGHSPDSAPSAPTGAHSTHSGRMDDSAGAPRAPGHADHGGHQGHASRASSPAAVVGHGEHAQHAVGVPPDEHKGHGGSHDHAAMMSDPRMAAAMERDMRNRFLVSFLLTIPVILYSELGETIFGDMPPAPFGLGMEWMGFILATPVVLYGGWVFILGTYDALRSRRLDMSVLIFTGVAAAYLYSVGVTFTGGGGVV